MNKIAYIWQPAEKKFEKVHEYDGTFQVGIDYIFNNYLDKFKLGHWAVSRADSPPTPIEEAIVGGGQ
jgi:hypothetical protein